MSSRPLALGMVVGLVAALVFLAIVTEDDARPTRRAARAPDRRARPSRTCPTPTPGIPTAEPARDVVPAEAIEPGERIVFVRDDDIYSISPVGLDLRRLTGWREEDCCPAISPDGSSIAFIRDTNRRHPKPDIDYGPLYERFDIFIMGRSDGTRPRPLTDDHAEESELAWSPDGSQLAFSQSSPGRPEDILVMDASAGSRTRLTSGKGNSGSPSWSPDGKRIAFSANYRACQSRDCSSSQIFLMRADGRNERVLISGGESGAVAPEWSPDGDTIAFLYGYYCQFDLFLARADGDIAQRLTSTVRSEGDIAWSPEGERIVYSADGDLYILDVGSGTIAQLTDGEEWDREPTWGVLMRS